MTEYMTDTAASVPQATGKCSPPGHGTVDTAHLQYCNEFTYLKDVMEGADELHRQQLLPTIIAALDNYGPHRPARLATERRMLPHPRNLPAARVSRKTCCSIVSDSVRLPHDNGQSSEGMKRYLLLEGLPIDSTRGLLPLLCFCCAHARRLLLLRPLGRALHTAVRPVQTSGLHLGMGWYGSMYVAAEGGIPPASWGVWQTQRAEG